MSVRGRPAWRLRRADVAVPDDAAVLGADDQVELAVAVPVGGDRGRVAVHLIGSPPPSRRRRCRRQLLAIASIGKEIHLAEQVADEQIDRADRRPSRPRRPTMRCRVDRLPSASLGRRRRQRCRRVAPEEVDLTGPGAGEYIVRPSPSRSTNCGVKPMHQPSGTRRSGRRPRTRCTTRMRFGARADVAVEAQPALVGTGRPGGRACRPRRNRRQTGRSARAFHVERPAAASMWTGLSSVPGSWRGQGLPRPARQ